MNNLAIIILAAGKGTRMKSATPKVLHKIGYKPMIEHVLETALALRPKKIVTVLGPEMNDIKEKISDISEVAIQQQQQGTGDAVKAGLHNLKGFKGNIVILYADTPLIRAYTIEQLVDTISSEISLSILGFKGKKEEEYGRLITADDNELKEIVEYREITNDSLKENLCNSGIMVVKSSLLFSLIEKIDNRNQKLEYYLTDLVDIATKQGHKCSYLSADNSEVIGVNDRIQLSEAEKIYQNRLRRNIMNQGITLIDPDTVFLSHDMKIGRDITIHPYVIFGPEVILEDNVEILPYSHIAGANISRGSRVGPFARLRPGTDLGMNSHIGNFVEVKKSEIGNNSKINHLSYIGDSKIGHDTNIGAGVITCNYDGYNKHTTEIGSGVFVGSNSSLIAPIKIESHAVIGAGSTITKDVSENEMIIVRGNKISRPGGAINYRKSKSRGET